MDDLRSRLGYLRGLADGLGVGEETGEGKVIRQIIAVLDDLADSLEEVKEDYEELFSYMEAIDEDLTELEDTILEGEDDDYDYLDSDDDDDDYDYLDDDELDLDDDEISFTVECPECRHEVVIDEDILEDEESLEVLCPKCGRVVFINDEDWDEELEEDLPDETDEGDSDQKN